MLKISIVIALKNEAENVNKLFASLRKINFPNINYEIIFIDDNSSDDTLNRVKENLSESVNYSVYKVDVKKYPGKKGALAYGIERAKYDFVMITDADCIVPPLWLQLYSEKFMEGYEFIFSPAPFFQKKFLVNKISCFENLRSSFLTFSFYKMGMPYNCFGRNMGFSKKLFNETQGYENTLEVLSGDDDLLLREAVKRNFKIGIIEENEVFVFSNTKKSFKDYLKQKSRHLKTSHYYSLKVQILIGLWHVINLVMLFSLLLVPVKLIIGIIPLTKIIFDIAVVKSNQKKYLYNFKIHQIIYLQVLYEFMLIINFLNSFIKKDVWK